MARPLKCRRVCCQPKVGVFKPPGVALDAVELIVLHLDELEAIRLADLEGLYHAEAAERMGISRQTFGTIVARARRKVTMALVAGKALRIVRGDDASAVSGETRAAAAAGVGR